MFFGGGEKIGRNKKKKGGGSERTRKRNMNIRVERGVGKFHLNPKDGTEIPVLVVPSRPTELEKRRMRASPRLERIL
jgi:hypothetical protein